MGVRKLSFYIGVVAALFGAVRGQDTSVCTPVLKSPTDPDYLKFPDQVSTYIEMNIVSRNTTYDFLEVYDAVGYRAALHMTEGFDQNSIIFDYATKQVYVANAAESVCTVSDMASNGFGFLLADKDGKLPSFGKTLRFNDKYKVTKQPDMESHRGILTDVYQSCVYMVVNGRPCTMNVKYYFANQDAWQVGTGTSVTPVRVWIKGTSQDDATTKRPFEHRYEFTFFSDNVDGQDASFLTPPNVPCKGRKTTQPLPKIGRYMSFTAEVVNTGYAYTTVIPEYFDSVAKLVRIDSRPSRYDRLPFGTNSLITVDDFNTGVTYIIDKYHKNCTIMPLLPTRPSARPTPDGYVRMRSPEEYLDLDAPTDGWVFQGQRTIRDILTDVYINTRLDFPPRYVNLTTIWQWHFAASPWYDNSGQAYDFAFPVRLEISAPQEPKVHYIFNFYDYAEEQPQVDVFDISTCYLQNNNVKRVAFMLPVTSWNLYLQEPNSFKYQLRKTIVENTGLSYLRIAQINMYRYKDGVAVRLFLLDKAPIAGSVASPTSEVSLDTAYSSLKDAISKNLLQVQTQGAQPVTLIAYPYTGGGAAYSTDGYTPGAMAAVGMSMVVVGALLGILGLLLFTRLRSGGTSDIFLPKRFENTPENNS